MEFSIAIPARYRSKRLPGKVLADLCGKPVLRRVWDVAKSVAAVVEVVILTESPQVKAAVESWGGRCEITPDSCMTGTERIAWALEKIPGDYIVNFQADEPFLEAATVEALVAVQAEAGDGIAVRTPIYAIRSAAELNDPSVVKVVRGHGGEALYFSRCPVPHIRDCPLERWPEQGLHFGHIGIYLYGREILSQWHSMPRSQLAEAESLEQLRLLQAAHKIGTVLVGSPSLAIDTVEDLERARKIFGGGGITANG